MKERGSALLTAVIIIMVLLSISGIFLTRVIYQAKNVSSEERGLKAYYMAEAGIQYGIAALLKGTLLVEKEKKNPFGQGGKFVVTVHKTGATTYGIISTGYYGSYDTKRTIEAAYEYSEEGGDGCEDDNELLDYPLWDEHAVYRKGTNSHVTYIDDEGNERFFYNLWYADYTNVPGEGTNDVWQEITIKWKPYNRYKLAEINITCFEGKKYKVTQSGYSNNQQPGVVGNPWNEITNEWRDFNVYKNQGDMVVYNSRLFRARNYSFNQRPGLATSPWDEITHEWRDFNNYSEGDIVVHGGGLFRARNDGADSQQPGLMDSAWQELTEEWREFNIYQPSDGNVYNEVVYNGQRYRAMNYSKNARPDINSTNSWDVWKKISSSPITPPVFLGVMVTPGVATIQKGQTQQFTAKAIYSNGTTTDVTANWLSSNMGIATIASGVATAHETGVTTGIIPENTPISIPTAISIPITATVTIGGITKTGTAFLTVSAPTTSTPGSGSSGGTLLWKKEKI